MEPGVRSLKASNASWREYVFEYPDGSLGATEGRSLEEAIFFMEMADPGVGPQLKHRPDIESLLITFSESE